ncbi:adenine nucleotide alpha hydrolase family protein [Streptomyces lavendulae]|uniref:hypothetical protein n=1 Tax=Streptomyces lavendulae TaxID=1914 RepID=UPI0036938B8E
MSNRITVGPDGSGVDLRGDCGRLLAFAREEADRRACPLVVVHGWSLPPVFSCAPTLDPGIGKEMADGLETALREPLGPWEQQYPQLAVDASIGPVTHAVMHHATSPVAVVAHD